MFQTERQLAIEELHSQILSGCTPADSLLARARVVMPSTRRPVHPGNCVVCGCTLIGHQVDLCFGHWDVVIVPGEACDSTDTLLEFIEQHLLNVHFAAVEQPWPVVTKGLSRCEICDAPTNLVEELRSGHGHTIKRHVVCPDHVTCRCVSPS